MSIHKLTVILDNDYNEQSAQDIANAVMMIRGVESVLAGDINSETTIARMQATTELKQKILDIAKNL